MGPKRSDTSIGKGNKLSQGGISYASGSGPTGEQGH
jgi:hypothetical protein